MSLIPFIEIIPDPVDHFCRFCHKDSKMNLLLPIRSNNQERLADNIAVCPSLHVHEVK